MNLRTFMATSVMVSGATCGVASAQSPGMRVLHAKATGSCPALDWHIAVEPTVGVGLVTGGVDTFAIPISMTSRPPVLMPATQHRVAQ